MPLALFRDEPFLLLKEGNDTRQRADRLCAKAGFRPGARLLLDQQLTAYNLACYGRYLCQRHAGLQRAARRKAEFLPVG